MIKAISFQDKLVTTCSGDFVQTKSFGYLELYSCFLSCLSANANRAAVYPAIP
jgi:hypothetical protein